MSDSDELDRLRTEITEMSAALEMMRRELDTVRCAADAHPAASELAAPPIEIHTAVTRRGWMKAAAAAAVGGAAAATLGSSGRVAAVDPNDLALGSSSTTDQRTAGRYTGNSSGMAFLFETKSGFSGTTSAYPAALGGWTGNTQMPNGVYGYTNVDSANAAGIVGITGAPAAVGVRALNASIGGRAVSASAPGNGGIGVTADGGFVGVSARSGQYGVGASGDTAALLLTTSNPVAPPDRTDGQEGGSIDVQLLSDSGAASLWFCSAPGSPGIWQKLAGPSTAGAFHAIDPTRVYDSRVPQPNRGILAAGGSRVVSVADGRDPVTGAVTVAGIVPDGATAIAYNLTVTDTVGAGFATATPGSSTAFSASSINWSSSGTTIANAGVVRLDLDRRVKVFVEGGATHFILDVTGYYR